MYELPHWSVQTAFGPEVPSFSSKLPCGVEGGSQVNCVVVEVVDVTFVLVVEAAVVVGMHESTLGSAESVPSKLRTAS